MYSFNITFCCLLLLHVCLSLPHLIGFVFCVLLVLVIPRKKLFSSKRTNPCWLLIFRCVCIVRVSLSLNLCCMSIRFFCLDFYLGSVHFVFALRVVFTVKVSGIVPCCENLSSKMGTFQLFWIKDFAAPQKLCCVPVPENQTWLWICSESLVFFMTYFACIWRSIILIGLLLNHISFLGIGLEEWVITAWEILTRVSKFRLLLAHSLSTLLVLSELFL